MYLRKILCSCIFFYLISSFNYASETKTVCVSDYGIIPGKKDATPLVRLLLDSLRTCDKALYIHFPKGEYHFYPDEAFGKYHCITNHSNLYRYFAFPLIGFTNINIDGNGSLFVFHGVITPFLVENSTDVHIKNFSIDWEVPFYIQAEVKKVDSPQRSVEIEMDKTFSNYEFNSDRLKIKGEDWRFEFLGQNVLYDSKTKAVAYRTEEATLFNENIKVEKLSDTRFKLFWYNTLKLPETGQIATFRGAMTENRIAPAIHIINSKEISLFNLTVYHCAGMGVIAEKSRDIHLNGFNVRLCENSGRIASTMADATHFCNCAGKLLVENCLFENMLDDAINVHGTYMQIKEIVNPKTVIARLNHYQQTDYKFAFNNDSILFVNENTLLPLGYGIVIKVEYINEYHCKLTFKDDLPREVNVNDGLDNISWYPEEFIFRNNTVRNNRARAILVSSRGRCIIENNTISTMKSAILVEGDLNGWFESGAVRDLIIRNNTFGNTSYGGGDFPTIFINPQVKKHETGKYYEKNIRIENNTFSSFNSNLLFANSVNGLSITGNTFTETKDYADYVKWQSPFRIINSKNVLIRKNTYKRQLPCTVKTDEETGKTIKSDIPIIH